MKKCAFIGGYDKTEILLFLAKIATLIGRKVLIIDATIPQKARYIVPVMTPTQKYITNFENIDIAIGFESFQDILEYTYEEELPYDMVLIDIDSEDAYYDFEIDPQDEHCLITGFDLYSLRKGIEVLEAFDTPTKVTKVYFTKDMLPEEDEYLSRMCENLKVVWDEEIIYFPFERGDRNILNINQRFAKIKIRGLSKSYLEGIMFIAEQNLGLQEAEIRKAMKIMEKA